MTQEVFSYNVECVKNMHEIYFWFVNWLGEGLINKMDCHWQVCIRQHIFVKLIWNLSLLCSNCMNLREETHCDYVSSLKLWLAWCNHSSYKLCFTGVMSVDSLKAERAGCSVMEILIHSVTSYAIHEEFVVFWRVGVGVGFMSLCNWCFIFTLMILKF
jgi:hypothetical protein